MLKIYKYPLKADSTIDIPKGAVFLSVQVQYSEPQMWFVVNPEGKRESRRFVCYATGESFDSLVNERFLGTFQLEGGRLVFHVFEIIKK